MYFVNLNCNYQSNFIMSSTGQGNISQRSDLSISSKKGTPKGKSPG